jgi:hypothetical protein
MSEGSVSFAAYRPSSQLDLGVQNPLFLDAYSRYHQITMKESDQLVTSFFTPFGSFCYVKMPFSLKNAGATYQRCMLKCFRKLTGETIESYMDDIVVKSKKADQLMVKGLGPSLGFGN